MGLSDGQAWESQHGDEPPLKPFTMTSEDRKNLRLKDAVITLCTKWNTSGQKVDSDDFYAAINEVYETAVGAGWFNDVHCTPRQTYEDSNK